MPEALTFQHVYRYSLETPGIVVPIRLDFAGKFVTFKAKIDTGASYSIFWRGHGEEMGLNIEDGIPDEVSTAMGNFHVYGHQLRLTTVGISLDTTVYFAAHPQFNRNVLGRQGWLDRLKIGLVDYEGKLLVSHYDQV